MVGRVWRKLQHDGVTTTMLIPSWESATWWRLVVPDGVHFAKAEVDWCGFPSRTSTCLSRARRPKEPLSHQIGRLWPSGLISRPAGIEGGSRSTTCAFAEVAVPAGAAHGTASGRTSGWSLLDVSREDPVELALASDLQKSALSHVAESSCEKYTG